MRRTAAPCLSILPGIAAVIVTEPQAQATPPQVPAADSGSDIPRPEPGPAIYKTLSPAFSKTVPKSIADLKAIEQHVKNLLPQVSRAVVAVEVGAGTGSGVVITPDGLVLTAAHVAERPNREVRFTFPNGNQARGKTLGLDRDSDAGLMRITDPGPWPHVSTGNLRENALGDWVLALGNPGGFDSKRSLVVRLGRILRLNHNILQTDCPISPGDSGGPLFDMHGRVIGVHTAISDSLAENFHIPITEFSQNWTRIVNADGWQARPGKPHAWLGARGSDHEGTFRITAIEQNSPASRAGLKIGDIVTRIEERQIKTASSFRRWINEAQPGEILHLDIQRGKQTLQLEVKLGVQPKGN